MSTPNSWFRADTSNRYFGDVIPGWGIECKKIKLTPPSDHPKVDQFPTCFPTAQSLQEREGFPAMSQSHPNSMFSDWSSFMELETGVTNTDLALESEFQFDTSNGYLGDVIALAGYDILSNEQKLSSCSEDQKVHQFPRFSTTAQPLNDCGFTRLKDFTTTNLSPSPQGDTHEAAIKHDPAPSQGKKIVYPFKLVKSGGVEGETTLKDINNQILNTPSTSKPIPHPVKDSETRPCKFARGFTGKEVTSRTMIRTRGRGSIIIIRTKD